MINERQRVLYEYLTREDNMKSYNSKESICEDLCDYYPRNNERTTEHNSRVFSMLRHDIRTINKSKCEHIIVSNHRGYKIANREEAIDYVERRFKRDLSSLKIDWNIRNKIGEQGQMVGLEGKMHIIDTFFQEGELNG